MLHFTARQAWNHGLATTLLDIPSNGLAVVSLIAEHLLGIAVDIVHQGRIGGDIVDLAGRNLNANRQTIGIGAGVDLGREAAARTAERVAPGPPFPPLAQ